MMENNEFEEIFNQNIQDIFGNSNDEKIFKEISEKAKEFKSPDEVMTYMESVMQKIAEYNKTNAWEILFKNLSIDMLDENFEALFGMIDEYKKSNDWSQKICFENIIKNLPEEIKLKKYEKICEYILDKECTMQPLSKLSMLYYDLATNFNEPEKYKGILDAVDAVDTEYYKDQIRKRILLALPNEFIIQNYEEVSNELFATDDLFYEEILMFLDKTFDFDNNLTDEKINELFTVIIDQLERRSEVKVIDKKKIYDHILEKLPQSVFEQNAKELAKYIRSKGYSKILGISEDGQIDYDMLSENLTTVIDAINSNNEYDYKRVDEQDEIIKLLPSKFVKENIILCFERFNSDTYEDLVEKLFENIEDSDFEKIKSVIVWIEKNSQSVFGEYTYKKDFLLESIQEKLPSKFIKYNVELLLNNLNPNNIEELYGKIFESNDDNEEDRNLTEKNFNLVLYHIEKQNLTSFSLSSRHSNVIKVLSNSFVKNNIEVCFERFSKNIYSEFLSKAFTFDDGEKIDVEQVKKTLEFVKSKLEEKYDYEDVLEKRDFDECWNKIVTALPLEFVNANAEFMILLMDKKIPNETKKYLLQNIPEKVIRNYEEKLSGQINIESIGSYLRYFEYITANPDMSVITNSIGIKVFNFIQMNQNNDNPDFLKIKEVLEHEKSKFENPDMSKYEMYLPDNYSEMQNLMDENTFENFIKDIETIKLLNGNIPEKYCDYILKQKITKDSPLNQNIKKYLPMLKRTFEDKVKHMLSKNELDGYEIEFFENDGSTLGYHNKETRTIGFLEDNLMELDETNTHIINTAYHEVKHGIQAKYYNTTDFSNLNGSLYNMIKEEIIRNDDLGFYRRNYTRMYCEIDARVAGTKGQADYLKYLGVSDEQIIESIGSDKTKLRDIVVNNEKQEQENANYATNKVDREGRIVSISQKASELIKKNPEWLKTYPVLALEYDENGERKKTPEILSNAISCNDFSIQDIYIKMFENGVSVSLNDAAETLEYISKLLSTQERCSEDIVKYINLIIKNETFESLRDTDINDIECKRVLSLLNGISKNNPNLDISKYIDEKLTGFYNEGKIDIELKMDKGISDSAISTMLNRNIKTKEEFDELLHDLPKVMVDREGSNFNLGFGFNKLFDNYFKNDPTIDFNMLLGEALECFSKANWKDIIGYSWRAVPDDLKAKHLHGFVNTCSKYIDIDYEFVYKTINTINDEEFEKNPNLGITSFADHLSTGMLPFAKKIKTKVDLEAAIAEAQSAGGKYADIKKCISEIVNDLSKDIDSESVEMLFTQMDFIKEDFWKTSAISSYFIYSSKEVQERNIERILKYVTIEKDYFDEEAVNSVIDSVLKYAKKEIFDENPMLIESIEKIRQEALELAKTRTFEEKTKDTFEIGIVNKEKIKTTEEFISKIQEERENSGDDWDFLWKVNPLLKENFNKDSGLDYNFILSSALELVSDEYRRKDMLKNYWSDMPEDMRLEHLNGFVDICANNGNLNFEFALEILNRISKEELKRNPELIEDTFGKHLKPVELIFLNLPQNVEDLNELIRQSEEKGIQRREMTSVLEEVLKLEYRKGNPNSPELLYRQLELDGAQISRSHSIALFFIYAKDEMKDKNVEGILRHTLIDKAYFNEEKINSVVKSVKDYMEDSTFEEVSDLFARIEKIQEEAIELIKKQEENTLESDGIVIQDGDMQVDDNESAKEEMALMEIRNSVPDYEISTGKKVIQVFLAKAKEVKKKIGKFFGGGDDHDFR